jgi:hypothetical protein
VKRQDMSTVMMYRSSSSFTLGLISDWDVSDQIISFL